MELLLCYDKKLNNKVLQVKPTKATCYKSPEFRFFYTNWGTLWPFTPNLVLKKWFTTKKLLNLCRNNYKTNISAQGRQLISRSQLEVMI